MNRIYIMMAAALLVFASCHQPEFVEPTAERQGITSLTAYFTSGPFTEMELGKLEILDGEELDRYVIPIPWFYPEESYDVTTLHLSKVRVRAELAENCKIDPPLTILDLNVENSFTYTNSKGESKPIIITGQRVKSSTSTMVSMNLVNPATGEVVIEGFVDNDEQMVYLFTVEDMSGLVAEVTPWYHATVDGAFETGEKTGVYLFDEPQDWNQELTITVTAHDGKSKTEFAVVKRNPVKIDYGFNPGSVKELFNIDPVSRLGVPAYTQAGVLSTLAYSNGHLVVSHGDGSAPIYLDGRNGSKLGEIATGGLAVGAVTNDEAGNILLCNRLQTSGTFEIYRTASVTEAPTLYYSYESEISLPLGSKMKVIGDIDHEACIVVYYEGVAGVTSASQVLNLLVEGGAVVDAQVVDFSSAGYSWGSAPENSPGIVATSVDMSNGWFYASYTLNGMSWVKQNMSVGSTVLTDDMDNAWLMNPSCLDSKRFNNATYMALLVCHHFPAWAGQPSVWVYDISDPANTTGNYQNPSSCVTYNSWITYFNATNAEETVSSGDVVMGASPDGFKVYIYYYDHYAGVIGGYSADCVKK